MGNSGSWCQGPVAGHLLGWSSRRACGPTEELGGRWAPGPTEELKAQEGPGRVLLGRNGRQAHGLMEELGGSGGTWPDGGARGPRRVQAGSCWGGAAGGHVARWRSSGAGGHLARQRSSGAGGHVARRRSSGPQEGPGRGREHVPGERRAWGSFPSQSPQPPLEPHAAHPGQHPGPRPTGVGGAVAVRALLPCSPSSGCMRPPGAPARRRPESRPTPLPLRDPSPHLSACPEPSPGAALGQPPTEAPGKA